MKRFIFKSLLFIVSFATMFFALNALYVNTNYWKSENRINKFSDIPYNLELGNLGSSHTCYGIKYDVEPDVKAWNFALSSQRYFWDYGVLKEYIDHFAENAIVLIPISYFGVTGRMDYSKLRKRYYRILPKESMDYWNLKEYLLFCKLPFLSAGANRIRIFHDIPKEQMSPYFNRTAFLEGEKLTDFCIKRHKQWTQMDKVEGYEENIKEISSVIDLCYSHKLRPVLITMPVTDVLNGIYANDADFFPTFEKFSNDLCKKYEKIIYLDYSRDERFTSRHDLFSDGDHLNTIGAEVFTKLLLDDLRNRNML